VLLLDEASALGGAEDVLALTMGALGVVALAVLVPVLVLLGVAVEANDIVPRAWIG
jgi:hypothetical protein